MNADPLDKVIKHFRSDHRVKIVLIGFCLALFWLLWAGGSTLIARWAGTNGTIPEAGTWGDSFGGFNAIVSTLGFIALYYTIHLQIEASKAQERDQHLQRFEATFFELCRLIRELRGEIKFRSSDDASSIRASLIAQSKSASGPEAITLALSEVRRKLTEERISTDRYTKNEIEEIYIKSIHRRFESRFAPYFRLIYTVLHKTMKDPVLSDKEKAYYGNLVRSQLTSHEISLLAINATAEVSNDLFDHIVYFRMLKYLPNGKLRRMLEDVFPPIAFAKRD